MLGHLVGYVGFHAGLWLMEKFNTGFILGDGSLEYEVPWRSLERTIQRQPKTFRLRFIFGAVEGLCWTNVGPFWVYVGSMLGPCWVWWAMLGHLEAMLGLC